MIGGTFNVGTVNGMALNDLARLNADGSVDTSFNLERGINDPGLGIDFNFALAFNYSVRSFTRQSDGNIVFGGNFTTVNHLSHISVARIIKGQDSTPTPTPTPTLTPTPTPPGCTSVTFVPNRGIPDGTSSGINIPLAVSGLSGTINDLNVRLDNVQHMFVGDLKFTLTAPNGTVSSVLVDRPGVPASAFGCGADNFINTVLDDEAVGGPIENVCADGMTGSFTPNNPLSVFDGLSPNGSWTLNAADLVTGITGTVQSVSLIICTNGSPTPTPTPTPTPLQLLLEESGPSLTQAAALDSVLFTRDPFPVVNGADLLNLGADRNTRVIIFVMNLQLAQGETASSVVVSLIDSNNQTYDVAAEDVRPVPNFPFTQVIFRLPNNLPVGTCTIRVRAHGQVSNLGSLRIRI